MSAPTFTHGGRLRAAAAQFGIPLADWLDISTGINPQPWPVPPVPLEIWQRLPEDEDRLEAAAQHYYQTPHVLPVSGSQAAIALLPALLKSHMPVLRCGLLSPTYNEHPHHWRKWGFDLQAITADSVDHHIDALGALLIVNPNNPTGDIFTSTQLLAWHKRLATRGGWLIVDEAFCDAMPAHSLAAHAGLPNLVMLRSLGKFFGLAGARVGFVLTESTLLSRIKESLGQWTINNPARWVAKQALVDTVWRHNTRQMLAQQSVRLTALLTEHNLSPDGGCALFQWHKSHRAFLIFERLARQGILARYFEAPQSLRFGLPSNESQWKRLSRALDGVNQGQIPSVHS